MRINVFSLAFFAWCFHCGSSSAIDVVDSGTLDAGEECPVFTAGPTVHSGDAMDNEIWTAAASPHVVESTFNIRDGHKLTIEPCASLKFAKGAGLQVATSGVLLAEGTATRPISFDAATTEAWAGVYVAAPGTARLGHVTLSRGGSGAGDGATLEALGDNALPADPVLFLDNVRITMSFGTGLYMHGGSTFVSGSKDVTIQASGSQEFPFVAEIDEHSMDGFPTGVYVGNRIDEILLRTTGTGVSGVGLTVDATLHDRGVPYRVGRDPNESFYLGGKENAPLATLTIEPGVVMRFVKGSSLLVEKSTGAFPAQAAVRALGTQGKPIVFTSADPAPGPGAWQGIWFGGKISAQNKFDHVRIEYAGGPCLCSLATCSKNAKSEGAVILTSQPAAPFITNSTFKLSAMHAVSEGFEGAAIDFKPTNVFEGISGCSQTFPRPLSPLTCPSPQPECD